MYFIEEPSVRLALFLLRKANNFYTNFWHSEDKSDFLPILQKNAKYNNNL
jgi:hypothetical protein